MARHIAICAALAIIVFNAPPILADDYTFTHFAGTTGGPSFEDGTTSTARFSRPQSVAIDREGNLYVADADNSTIRKITPDGTVATLAGLAGVTGRADGVGSEARFDHPTSLTVDANDNIYVSDTGSSTIRKVTLDGHVTTLAGWNWGTGDGTGVYAQFNGPRGLTTDHDGNVYVADTDNHTIRKVTPEGVVTTLAGLGGVSGSQDGTGSAARFVYPSGVALDSHGDLFVADAGNHVIRRITPAGEVTRFAGWPGQVGNLDGGPVDSRFDFPRDLRIDESDNIYVSDTGNSAIRKVTPEGIVTTIVGWRAGLWEPTGIARDAAGNIYVAATSNHEIAKVTPEGQVSTFAGSRMKAGWADGSGQEACFGEPRGIARDSEGNLFVVDSNTHVIRKVTPQGVVTTLAGDPLHGGSADGTGSAAQFAYPNGIAIGPDGTIFVADWQNQTIRKISKSGVVTTFAGVPGEAATVDGTGPAARFYYPASIAVDSKGNVFVGEGSNAIRKITPDGVVTTLAGVSRVEGSADGTGAQARFAGPTAILVDPNDDLYVSDSGNSTIRKITAAGVVTTVAGQAGKYGAVDGLGPAAEFHFPAGLAMDGAGMIYICDSGNHAIRKLAPNGAVVTIGGRAGYIGSRDGVGSQANFNGPYGIAADSAGQLWITDTYNDAIRLGQAVLPDAAVIDTSGGNTGAAHQLSAYPQTGSSYQWALIRRPAGSVAQLSATTSATSSFTPDVSDLYVFRLTAMGAAKANITTVALNPVCGKPTATLTGTSSICAGSAAQLSVALTGSAPWSVTWSDGFVQNGITRSPVVRNVSPASSTTYTVTAVSNACGAGTSSGSAIVTVKGVPGAIVSGAASISSGGSTSIRADLTGTAPWALVWSDGYVQNAASTPATRAVTPGSTFNYTISDLADAQCHGSSLGSARVIVTDAPVIGGNALANPGFDYGIAEWCASPMPCSWDAAGHSLAANPATSEFVEVARQCVDVPVTDLLALAGRYRVPSGSQTGHVRVSATFYPQPSCSGSPVTVPTRIERSAPADGAWKRFGKNVAPPPLAVSAAISLEAGDDSVSGAFATAFDDLYFGPAPIDPQGGATGGGTSVSIRGSGFQAGATVAFGGAPAVVTSVDAGKVVATTAASAMGSVDVVLTNPDTRSTTLASSFLYTHPGDANGDMSTDALDIFYLANLLFSGGDGPAGSGDANGDGVVNVADMFFLINYTFAGGPAPAP